MLGPAEGWPRGTHSTQGLRMGLALGFRSLEVRVSTLASLWAGVRMVRGDLREALVTECRISSGPGLT